jgi:hypothetical protein
MTTPPDEKEVPPAEGKDATPQGETDEERAERRRRVIEESAGLFSGMYPPSYLERLREDWPD